MKAFRLCSICVSVAVASTTALAAPAGGDLGLDWHTIDCGGAASSGGPFVLTGTIGQPDPGVMTGASFEIVGGFWAGAVDGGPPCPGDVDGNDTVDLSDLLAVLSTWGPYEPCPPYVPADIDRNCDVGLSDLLFVLSGWGPCP